MTAEEFSVWFAGVARLDAKQRGKVVLALAKLDCGRREVEGATETGAPAAARPAKARSEVAVRMFWERAAMSGWKAGAARTARG